MKRFVLAAAAALLGGLLGLGTVPALAAQGCGPGFHRGPYGYCRPLYGGAYAAPGYYRGGAYAYRGGYGRGSTADGFTAAAATPDGVRSPSRAPSRALRWRRPLWAVGSAAAGAGVEGFPGDECVAHPGRAQA